MTERNGQVALVTGGATGVGEALCRQLAAEGATVIVADIDMDKASNLAAELGATAILLDVSSEDAWSQAIDGVVADHGGLDMLALNAGIMSRPKGEPMGTDDPVPWLRDRYQLVRNINIDGVVFGVLAALSALEERGGRIVVTSSIAGLMPQPEDPAYTLTKHAVVGLVRSLAPTLAARGISIGAVCPGGIDTSLVPPDFRQGGHQFAPPSHVAAVLADVLDKDVADTGGIWLTLGVDDPVRRYEFTPLR